MKTYEYTLTFKVIVNTEHERVLAETETTLERIAGEGKRQIDNLNHDFTRGHSTIRASEAEYEREELKLERKKLAKIKQHLSTINKEISRLGIKEHKALIAHLPRIRYILEEGQRDCVGHKNQASWITY
jgi:DNA repair exonuclease SbcCD ATPase subunit